VHLYESLYKSHLPFFAGYSRSRVGNRHLISFPPHPASNRCSWRPGPQAILLEPPPRQPEPFVGAASLSTETTTFVSFACHHTSPRCRWSPTKKIQPPSRRFDDKFNVPLLHARISILTSTSQASSTDNHPKLDDDRRHRRRVFRCWYPSKATRPPCHSLPLPLSPI
jgi:hypothetical protein